MVARHSADVIRVERISPKFCAADNDGVLVISTLNCEPLQDDAWFSAVTIRYATGRKHILVWNTKNSSDKRAFQTE